MSVPPARLGAAALAVGILAAGAAACSNPPPTVTRVADAPAPATSPAPVTTTTESASSPSTSAPTAAPTATPPPTSVPPPARSAPTRTAVPSAAPSPSSRAASTPTPSPTPRPVPTPPPSPTGTDAYESQVLALVNAERTAAGLPPLAAQSCPDGFAEPWSPHMAAEGRLSHQALSPILSRCGGRAAAENVGMNSSQSPAAMVAGFMGSPPHRANILGAGYTGIGVGAYRDARGVWWVTQDFVG